MNFLQVLPNKLKFELSKFVLDKSIMKLNFFREQHKDFLGYVTPLLVPINFLQNDYVFEIGDFMRQSIVLYKI